MFVGIDVSIDVANEKVAVACRGTRASIAGIRDRSGDSLLALATGLKEVGPCRVALEASGGYERLVRDSLVGTGIVALLLQPGRLCHVATSLAKPAKTDPIDAAVPSRMAELGVKDHTPWPPREDDVEQLRDRVHRRDHVVTHSADAAARAALGT